MDWQERAIKERSLGEVYWKARKVGSTRTNFGVAVFVCITFGLFAVADWKFCLNVLTLGILKALVSQIAEVGFALTSAILGFLIAGFSIFASITRPAVFVGLAKLDHRKTGLSRLQFIFFNFLLVFVHYLAFLATSIFLKLVLPLGPTVVTEIQLRTELPVPLVWWSAVSIISLLLGWLTFLIMLLKSFIWNIYQAVLVVIITGDQIAELEKKLPNPPESHTR